MFANRRKPLVLLGVACTLGLGRSAGAHEGHDHPAPSRGGTVVMSKAHHFEVVFARDGLKVYPLAPADTPAAIARLTGTATLTIPGAPKPFAYALKPMPEAPGRPPAALGVAVDLGRVPVRGTTVAIRVAGLADPAEPTAAFTVPFAPGGGAPGIAVAPATKADEPAIAAQKTCKVSGEALDSMGGPLKVTLGGRSTYVCCQSCVKEIRANPAKFLGAPAPARP